MTLPHECRGFVHKKIGGFVRGAVGAVVGGIPVVGGIAGPIVSDFFGGDSRDRKARRALGSGDIFTGGPTRKFNIPNPRCPGGFADIGSTCNPANAHLPTPANFQANGIQLPPTDTVTTPAEFGLSGFQAVSGAFGMPAIAPTHELVGKFVCPPGMVLGEDNLCYPKAVLRRDSRFRKWRPGRRPIGTGGDLNTITRARSIVGRMRDATANLGLTVKKK